MYDVHVRIHVRGEQSVATGDAGCIYVRDDAAVVATQETYMPDAYVAGITEALDRLHADMPRAIVNLVVMFDISPLTNISDRLLCDAVQL